MVQPPGFLHSYTHGVPLFADVHTILIDTHWLIRANAHSLSNLFPYLVKSQSLQSCIAKLFASGSIASHVTASKQDETGSLCSSQRTMRHAHHQQQQQQQQQHVWSHEAFRHRITSPRPSLLRTYPHCFPLQKQREQASLLSTTTRVCNTCNGALHGISAQPKIAACMIGGPPLSNWVQARKASVWWSSATLWPGFSSCRNQRAYMHGEISFLILLLFPLLTTKLCSGMFNLLVHILFKAFHYTSLLFNERARTQYHGL